MITETVPTVTDWIQAGCAVILMIVAVVALFSWRSQKRFEATVELLSNSHKAKDYLSLLRDRTGAGRSYASSSRFVKELALGEIENTYERRLHANEQVLKFKEPELTNLYNIVLDMRTKAWVLFGKTNKFYKFYDEIVCMSTNVYLSHTAMVFVLQRLSKGGLSESEKQEAEKQEYIFHDRIYNQITDDPIDKRIEEMIAELENERPSFFWNDFADDDYSNY